MGIRYTEAFIEQALFKVYFRGERTVKSVTAELNINHHTLKNWMKKTGLLLACRSKKSDAPKIGMQNSSCRRCMKPMPYQVSPCKSGVVKTAYLPITSPAGKRLFAPM